MATKQLSITGNTINEYKAIDKKTGKVYGIAINNNGLEVDKQKLLQDENNAKKAKYGRLDSALSDKLKTVCTEDIGVIIWLIDQSKDKITKTKYAVNLTTDENSKVVQDLELEKIFNKSEKDRELDNNAITNPVSTKMQQKGYKHTVDTHVPVIYAKLKKDQINDIANWTDVDTIYLDVQAKSALNVARPTIYANTVYNRGIAGFGTKVGEIEVGGGIGYNPYLAPPIELDTLNTCTSDHATAVAGIIRSWHPSYLGTAPGTWLKIGGSCGGLLSELTSVADRVISWGATATTNSWANTYADGNLKYEDRYFDTITWNAPWVTNIIAAGNTGGIVTNPGLSYNSITVGAFDDMNTVSWSGDIMASYSGYTDGNNYMEKPEVAAPGSNIMTMKNAYPYYSNMGSGT